MTIKELLSQDIDIDIYDDVDESIGIAFVGPCKLTEEGEKYFAPIMDVEVDIWNDGSDGTLQLDERATCGRDMKLCGHLFYCFAGLWSDKYWNKWFKD